MYDDYYQETNRNFNDYGDYGTENNNEEYFNETETQDSRKTSITLSQSSRTVIKQIK